MFIDAISEDGCARDFASSPNSIHDTATGGCTASFDEPAWWSTTSVSIGCIEKKG